MHSLRRKEIISCYLRLKQSIIFKVNILSLSLLPNSSFVIRYYLYRDVIAAVQDAQQKYEDVLLVLVIIVKRLIMKQKMMKIYY